MDILRGENFFGYNKERIEKTLLEIDENSYKFLQQEQATGIFIDEMAKCCFNPRIHKIFDRFCKNLIEVDRTYNEIMHRIQTEIHSTAWKYAQQMEAPGPNYDIGSRISTVEFANTIKIVDDQGNTYIDKKTALTNLETLKVIARNIKDLLDELVDIVGHSGFVNERIIRQEIDEVQAFSRDVTDMIQNTHRVLRESIQNAATDFEGMIMGKIYAAKHQGQHTE